MKRKNYVPFKMWCVLRRMYADYQSAYNVQIPEQVFFEMILSLGFESMSTVISNKTDFMKSEVNEK